jgi:hypothetical protein
LHETDSAPEYSRNFATGVDSSIAAMQGLANTPFVLGCCLLCRLPLPER